MPVKSYDVHHALLIIQPTAQVGVKDNDTDQINYAQWSGALPTETEIDAAGVQSDTQKAARATEVANANAEVVSGPAPQSVPALQARVTAIEHLLGLRSDV